MKQNSTNSNLGRRRFLRLAGASSVGVAGLGSPALAKSERGRGRDKNRGKNNGNRNGNNESNRGRGQQPLEDTTSLVGNYNFAGEGNIFPGYPNNPDFAAYIPRGMMFDTTTATISPNRQTIHYNLQFGIDSKPYVLTHVGDKKYISRGAVINFELTEPNPQLGLEPGIYRATARDEVHLYDDGAYNWSVTRTDFFTRNREMNYSHSAIVIVWDEDGRDNADSTYRNTPTGDPEVPPAFDDNALPEIYGAINETAFRLINSGPATPGGQ